MIVSCSVCVVGDKQSATETKVLDTKDLHPKYGIGSARTVAGLVLDDILEAVAAPVKLPMLSFDAEREIAMEPVTAMELAEAGFCQQQNWCWTKPVNSSDMLVISVRDDMLCQLSYYKDLIEYTDDTSDDPIFTVLHPNMENIVAWIETAMMFRRTW